MKNATRILRLLGALVAVPLLFTACTPEQLATFQAETGIQLDDGGYEAMIALPDAPIHLNTGAVIDIDGTVVRRDQKSYVNGLPYSYQSKDPVMTAFRVVASSRGWTPEQIASWETAVWDIALKEAQGCWNVRYGARFASWDGANCALSRSGSGAAGYGQITSVLWPALCAKVGLCDGAAIVSSPWNSMLALISVIEDNGVRPWCYDRFSRSFHRVACNNPGIDVP